MKKKVKRVLFPFAFALMISVSSVPSAQAEELKKLTKKEVTAFIEKTTAITNGEEYEMSQEDISRYLNLHIHEDARFVSTMRFTMPGMPPQDTKLSLKKDEFIKGVEQGDKALDDYENEVEIKKVRISSNKKSATVKTVGMESGQLPTQLDSGETQYIPVEGTSECSQILKLEDGVIKMYNANCLTTIDMLSF